MFPFVFMPDSLHHWKYAICFAEQSVMFFFVFSNSTENIFYNFFKFFLYAKYYHFNTTIPYIFLLSVHYSFLGHLKVKYFFFHRFDANRYQSAKFHHSSTTKYPVSFYDHYLIFFRGHWQESWVFHFVFFVLHQTPNRCIKFHHAGIIIYIVCIFIIIQFFFGLWRKSSVYQFLSLTLDYVKSECQISSFQQHWIYPTGFNDQLDLFLWGHEGKVDVLKYFSIVCSLHYTSIPNVMILATLQISYEFLW